MIDKIALCFDDLWIDKNKKIRVVVSNVNDDNALEDAHLIGC